MWIRGFVAAFVFVLGGSVLCYVAGCGGDSEVAVDPASSPNDSAKGADPSPAGRNVPLARPLLEGWPKPALALLFTGQRHGYLEPCGCSPTQSGGLSRLADLVRQIDDKGWPLAKLDLGGTIKRDRLQSRFKFGTMLRAFKDLKYAGMALGTEELRLEQVEAGFLLSQFVIDPENPEDTTSFLAANVVFFDTPELGVVGKDNVTIPLVTRSKILPLGEKKVGVTAVFGKGYRATLIPEGARTDTTIQDPETVLPGVIADLKKQTPDLLVLLSHADKDETRALIQAFPDFDVVLTAGGPEDGDEQPEKIGNTLMINVGRKGKNAGVLGFYPDDPANRLRFELVDLDNRRFHETPRMHEHMREYQAILRDNYDLVLADLPKSPHPTGAQYVGAAKCGECHKKAYQKWKIDSEDEPHHSRAFKSLVIGRKGQEENWISRIHDPECLACHVTGWDPQEVFPYDSGFISQEKTPLLTAQQCENCHGPGSRHVEIEELWAKDRKAADNDQLIAERKAMKLTTEIAKERLCIRCHDPENSPNYSRDAFDKFWEKIKHPWKD